MRLLKHLRISLYLLNYNIKIMSVYSIILPIYNEEQNLPIVLFLLNEVSHLHSLPFEVVIVQDNSEDNSRKIVHLLANHFRNLNIKVVEREKKLGLGSAYRDGLQHCTGQYIIIMDADLSHHPKYIPHMIQKQKATGCHIVTGSRYMDKGGVEGWSFMRKLTSRTANFITKFALGVHCSDFTGSFRLYKKSYLQQLIAKTTTKGYSFQMQILVRAKRMHLHIEQIPIVFVDRLFGSSKLGPGEVLIYLRGVSQLFLQE